MINKGILNGEKKETYSGRIWDQSYQYNYDSKLTRKSSENSIKDDKHNYGFRKYSDNRNVRF